MPKASEILATLAADIERKRRQRSGDRLLSTPQQLPVAGGEKLKASDALAILLSGVIDPIGVGTTLAETRGISNTATKIAKFLNDPIGTSTEKLDSFIKPVSTRYNFPPGPEGDKQYETAVLVGKDNPSEAVVPRLTKVQRKALMTLKKFPKRELYTSSKTNPGIYEGEHRKPWGAKMDTTEDTLRPEFIDPQKVQFVRTKNSDAVAMYYDGIPVGSITTDWKGKVGISESAESARGRGLGSALYKFIAQQGKNIYDTADTSKDAAHARYSAITDMANRKFLETEPIKIDRPYSLRYITGEPSPIGARIPGKNPPLSTKKFEVPKQAAPIREDLSGVSWWGGRRATRTNTSAPNFDDLQGGITNRPRRSTVFDRSNPQFVEDTPRYEDSDQAFNKAGWLNEILSRLPMQFNLTNRGIPPLDPLRHDPLRHRLENLNDYINKYADKAQNTGRLLEDKILSTQNSGKNLEDRLRYARSLPSITRHSGSRTYTLPKSEETNFTRSLRRKVMSWLNDYYERVNMPQDRRLTEEEIF